MYLLYPQCVAGSSGAQPAIVPGAHALQYVDLVVALADAVRLARVDYQFDRHVVGAQRAVEPDGLIERHALVLLTVQDQHRRGRLPRLVDGAQLGRLAPLQAVPRSAAGDLALETGQV